MRAPASAAGGRRPGCRGPVALVVGTTSGGTGAHVRMLAAGLAARGIAVSVLGPAAAGARFGFGALDGVRFTPAEFGDRPRPRDVTAVLRLRRAVRGAAVVHAHGLRAGALTVLALRAWSGPAAGRRPPRGRPGGGERPPGLVVTVHNGPPPAPGASAAIYRLLEGLVARRADLVLCVSADLEARMRAAGARRVGRAVVPAAGAPAGRGPVSAASVSAAPGMAASGRAASVPAASSAEAGPADRPLVLAVGRLTAQKDLGTLLAAAVSWRDLEPAPLLAIAGDGPLAGRLRARAAELGVDAAFLGHRADVGALLAAATVFVLPSRWEGQPLVLQEALRAGVPIVATRVGGIPDLVGQDAALLVAPGDPPGLGAAIRAVLTDPSLAAGLRAAAARRGAALPTEDDAATAALASYATLTGG